MTEAIIEIWRKNPAHNHGKEYWSEIARCEERNATTVANRLAAEHRKPTRIRP